MTLKLEAGKKYRTRGGDEVEILRTDVRDEQPVVGIVTKSDGSQYVSEWNTDGSFWPDGLESANDLISEIRPKRVVWLNFYPDGTCGASHSSKEEADAHSSDIRIARIRVEFEEGQFDE